MTKKYIIIFAVLLALLQTLHAQHISRKAEKQLQERMLCAKVALLHGEKQIAFDIYKEVRDNGNYCQTAAIANYELAKKSYELVDLETLYNCVKYSEMCLEKRPSYEQIEELQKNYKELNNDCVTLYSLLRNNLIFLDDICGIWVSDYTEDEHKAPYLILEIERNDTGYTAHIHPNCQVAMKYPTYHLKKYSYEECSELPYTDCAIICDVDSVYAHFADKVYKKAHPEGARIAAAGGIQIIETAHEMYKSVTSSPDYHKQPANFRAEVVASTIGVMGVGLILGIVAIILENAKGYGYSISFEGVHPYRGEMECTLVEKVLEIYSSTGKEESKIKQLNMKMLKIYPDDEIRFIGYNNQLVGSHSFTKEEAKQYPEYKYRKDDILRHNEKCYQRLYESFTNSLTDISASDKERFKSEFDLANSGSAFGMVPTSYGFYKGELHNGEPLSNPAGHFLKRENSLYLGVVKDNKREGDGENYKFNSNSDLIQYTVGTWVNGKLSGHAVQDDYVKHQHFEGYYSDGYRHGKGVLWDTTNNIIYDGTWDNGRHWDDRLNGMVEERDFQGNILFEGTYSDNEREGHGLENYWDGSSYDGYWKNGQKHGDGTLQIPDLNERYKQTWKKGTLKSGHDIERNQNGDIVFKGEYKNDKRDGTGTEYYGNGFSYQGQWKRGEKHGDGELRLANTNKSYNQTWKHGKFKRGRAVEMDQNGKIVYEGDYKNEKRSGYGKEYYENDSVYEGHWKHGEKHGDGELRLANTNKSYNQTWKHGEFRRGRAVELDQNGKIVYEGEYKKKERSGYGTEYYENDCVYEGQWKRGEKHGNGKLKLANSDKWYQQTWKRGSLKQGMVVEHNKNGKIVFEGEYKNYKRNGDGIEYYENDCVYKGQWKKGKKHGEGELYVPSTNEYYIETWENGQFIKCEKL